MRKIVFSGSDRYVLLGNDAALSNTYTLKGYSKSGESISEDIEVAPGEEVVSSLVYDITQERPLTIVQPMRLAPDFTFSISIGDDEVWRSGTGAAHDPGVPFA